MKMQIDRGDKNDREIQIDRKIYPAGQYILTGRQYTPAGQHILIDRRLINIAE